MNLQKLMTSIIHNCEEVRESLCTIDFAEERELLKESIDTCKQVQNNVLQIFKVTYKHKKYSANVELPVNYYLAYNENDVKQHIIDTWVPSQLTNYDYTILQVKVVDELPLFVNALEDQFNDRDKK